MEHRTRCRTQATVRIISTDRNLWQADLRTSAGAKPGTECFYNVSMMEGCRPFCRSVRAVFPSCVVRETGWIERANNPKYPLEYIQAADRLANGKKSCCSPRNDQDREMSE